MGQAEVGVLHMQSFRDSKVLYKKQILIVEAHYFYYRHKKAASFLYEFLCEVGQNNCAYTHCSRGDTYITQLYIVFDVRLNTTCDQL